MADAKTRFPEEVFGSTQVTKSADAALAAAVVTDEIQKFNPNHDESGRFAEGDSSGGADSKSSGSSSGGKFPLKDHPANYTARDMHHELQDAGFKLTGQGKTAKGGDKLEYKHSDGRTAKIIRSNRVGRGDTTVSVGNKTFEDHSGLAQHLKSK